MRKLLILILVFAFVGVAVAQTTLIYGNRDIRGFFDAASGTFRLPQSTVAALPAAIGVPGRIYVVTDGPSCTSGGGSTAVLCRSNGTAWVTLGGSGVWGTITGTLSNQLDLAAALGGKEPTIAAGTTAQYWRGDKSWQTLSTAVVAAMSGLYEVPLTFSSGLTRSTNTITCNTSSGSVFGCLLAADWTAFNAKAGLSSPIFTGQPTIPDFTLAVHAHQSTGGGGTLDAAAIAAGVLAIARGGTGAATTSQNFAFIGPTSGSGAPSFRALVGGDIPSLSATYLLLHGKADTAGAADTATNLAGGSAGQFPYQTGAGATGFRTPNAANGPAVFDGSGNLVIGGTVSANSFTGDGSGLTGIAASGGVFTTLSFSATPTYTVSTSAVQVFKITLTGNITSATLTTTLATVGQVIAWEICQDGTGGRTVAWPTNVLNYGSVDTTASACSKQSFGWDGTNAIAIGGMVSDIATPGLITSAGMLGLPTAPDTLAGIAATQTLTNKTISGASNTLTVREADLSTTDITTANATSSKHGLLPKLSGSATTYLDGSGAFATPTITQNCDPTDLSQLCIVDNFCGGTTSTIASNGGAAGWILIAITGGTPVVGAPTVDTTGNYFCGVKLTGQATATDGAAITIGTMNNLQRAITAAMFQSGATFRPFDLKFSSSFNATTDIKWYAGLLGSTAAPTTSSNGCFFHFDTIGLADSGIIFSCGNASSLASTSAVTADTSKHRYRMWSTVAGSIHASVDGVEMTGSPVSKTVALGATNVVTPVLAIVNGASSTTNSAEFYAFSLKITGIQ